MTFTISVHAEKRARKRFKWRLPSLIKEASKALESPMQGNCQEGRYAIHNGIKFIFKDNNLVTLYPLPK